MKNIFYIIVLSFLVIFASCDNYTSSKKTTPTDSSSEDELVEIKEEYEDDCDECNGTGYVYYSCSSCGGLGETYHYSSETRPKECYNCYGTGKVRCSKCGGNGYIICEYCGGRGSSQCSVCHGYGMIIFNPTDPDTWIKCNACKGTGYAQCLICDGKGRYDCNWYEYCPVCYGSGFYGKENVSNSGYVTCSSCNGSGRYRSWCNECDGRGRVIKTRIVQKWKSEL